MQIALAYGLVNGKPVYDRDEFIYKSRGFGAIKSDKELFEYARKRTSDWQNAGHKRKFTSFYLSDFASSEPFNSLTRSEFERLKEIQKETRIRQREAEQERNWKLDHTEGFADNSVEEVWIDKDGKVERRMSVYPHGDIC